MKTMGLDVGSKTIGVALSDDFGWTAQGFKTIIWDENHRTSADDGLAEIIEEFKVKTIVIGLPKNMNGTIGERGEKSEHYGKYLGDKFAIPVILWDERLTTVAAERVLIEADMSRKKRKKVIDQMAASLILQGYLDSQN